MTEMLENIEKDIETVEAYLAKLLAAKKNDTHGSAGFAISVYTGMLYELYDRYREIKKYIEEADT